MKTILIVEDDKTLRENIAEYLKEEKYNVIYAEDGFIGVQLVMKHLPDLILCDIMMPNMNGFEFYKTIQQVKATATIPLIFLTAKVEKEDIREGMQLGADDYITKPFDFNELLKAIKVRLEKHEKIQQLHDEKFYALIDNPLMGVFIYQNNKFVYENTAFSKIFGLCQADFKNLSFDDIIADGHREMTMEKIKRCFRNLQSTVHIVFEAFHKDESKTHVVEVFGEMVTYKGIPSLIGNAIEVSEMSRNKAENPLLKTEHSPDNLSKREVEVLLLICKGNSTAEIANAMNISNRTIDTHRANIHAKTGTKNVAELVMYAIRNKMISFE